MKMLINYWYNKKFLLELKNPQYCKIFDILPQKSSLLPQFTNHHRMEEQSHSQYKTYKPWYVTTLSENNLRCNLF